ncbi:flagellar motor switch protein FliM [Alphaproteobacteria bacterium]
MREIPMRAKPNKDKGMATLLNNDAAKSIKLPMLNTILTKFVYLSARSLRVSVTEKLELDVDAILPLKLSEYIGSLATSVMAITFKAVEWSSSAAFFINSELVYYLLESVFGGTSLAPSLRVEDRVFTNIEKAVVTGIVEGMLNNLSTAFSDITSVRFIIEKIENNPKYALLISGEELGVLLRIRCSIGEQRSSSIDLALPYIALQPIKSLLSKPFANSSLKSNPEWHQYFKNLIASMALNVQVEINHTASTIGEFAKLSVGQTIIIDKLMHEEVNVKINGTLISKGKLGKIGDNLAVQLTEQI